MKRVFIKDVWLNECNHLAGFIENIRDKKFLCFIVLRDVLAGEIFDLVGAEYDPESTGMFLWGKVNGKGVDVSDRLLYEAGVFITPGFIFGKNGENHIRISLCAKPEVLKAAAERIAAALTVGQKSDTQ